MFCFACVFSVCALVPPTQRGVCTLEFEQEVVLIQLSVTCNLRWSLKLSSSDLIVY